MALLSCAFGAAAQPVAQPAAAPDIIEQIASCLHDGREVAMSPTFECVNRRAASAKARQANMPFGVNNLEAICDPNVSRRLPDPRVLPGDTVKRVAQQTAYPTAPSGIRIIGAIFCDELDIVGLKLPNSLVLDQTIFNKSINARNLRVTGDLSFDGSFMAGSFVLTRSQIEGSIYLDNTFINRIAVYDSRVQGTWHQSEAIVFEQAIFHGLSISGDMSIEDSALTHLLIHSVQIKGGLILDKSEARCAYHIKLSEIGYVSADTIGFGGMVTTHPVQEGAPALVQSWWSRLLRPGSRTAQRLTSPAAQHLVAAHIKKISELKASEKLRGCEKVSESKKAEFYFFDNRIQNSVCVTKFSWLEPASASTGTIFAVNGSTIANNAILDIWDKTAKNDNQASSRKLEVIGVSMGSLIFDFAADPKQYTTYIDGITFSRVRNGTLPCEYVPPESVLTADRNNDNSPALKLKIPSVERVRLWLLRSEAPSSQPVAAFIDAFERAGNDATDLRILRKSWELCDRTTKWWAGAFWCRDFQPVSAGDSNQTYSLASTQGDREQDHDVVWDTADLLAIAFHTILWPMVDHGLRPAKVVWWVVAVLALYWLFFWFGIRIVCFEPKSAEKSAEKATEPAVIKRTDESLPLQPATKPPRLWPMGILFLFDRLIPVYKIREEHYAIGKVYRSLTPRELTELPGDPRAAPLQLRYWGRLYSVRQASEADKERVEKHLVVVRIIGAILSVFLLAAINALISH